MNWELASSSYQNHHHDRAMQTPVDSIPSSSPKQVALLVDLWMQC